MSKADSRNVSMPDIVTDLIVSNNGSESGAQAVEQEEERAKNNQDVRVPAATKPVIYIPPRLDQEYYQAEVAASSSIIAPSLDSVRGTNKIRFGNCVIAVPAFYLLSNLNHADSSTSWFTGTSCVSSGETSREKSIRGEIGIFSLFITKLIIRCFFATPSQLKLSAAVNALLTMMFCRLPSGVSEHL